MKEALKKEFPKALITFLVLAAAILFYFFIKNFKGFAAAVQVVTEIVRPFIIGAAVAYLLIPISDWLTAFFCRLLKDDGKNEKKYEKKKRFIEKLSMALSLIFFLAIIAALFALVIPQLVASVEGLLQSFPQIIASLQGSLEEMFAGNEMILQKVDSIFADLNGQLNSFDLSSTGSNLSALMESLSSSIKSGAYFLKDFLVGLIVALYIMGSRKNFRRQARLIIYALFPYNWDKPDYDEQFADWLFREAEILNNYMIGFIKGKIIDSFIIGVICFAFMLVARMPYMLLISVIVGVTNIIPFFGPFIGAIPSILILLLIDPVKALIFAVFIAILQQLDGNVIGPKILGNATNLSSFWVLFAILLFGGLFGIVGMILGVPIFGFIYQLIREVTYKKVNRQREELKKHMAEAADADEPDVALSKEEL